MTHDDAPQRAPLTGPDIKALRERLGLSGQAFADRINSHIPGARANRQTVYRWESGRHPVSPIYAEVIRRIAEETD